MPGQSENPRGRKRQSDHAEKARYRRLPESHFPENEKKKKSEKGHNHKICSKKCAEPGHDKVHVIPFPGRVRQTQAGGHGSQKTGSREGFCH